MRLRGLEELSGVPKEAEVKQGYLPGSQRGLEVKKKKRKETNLGV
jgi:hypothetical protein